MGASKARQVREQAACEQGIQGQEPAAVLPRAIFHFDRNSYRTRNRSRARSTGARFGLLLCDRTTPAGQITCRRPLCEL